MYTAAARRSARAAVAGRPFSGAAGGPAATSCRAVNGVRHERGEYGRVTDADVRHFRSLLGEPNVLTGAQNVGPYNADYLKHVPGKRARPLLFGRKREKKNDKIKKKSTPCG